MATKEGERSGYTSPDMPPTPATSHQLKRTASQETLATEVSEVSSSPSLVYPHAPLNTPANPSIAGGDEEEESDLLIRSAADIASVANRLQHTTPPTSLGTGDAGDAGDDELDDPFREGKAHLRAHMREDSNLTRQLLKSPERHSSRDGKKTSRHEMLKKSALAAAAAAAAGERTNTPTLLRHVNTVINLSSPHQLTPSLSTDTLKGSDANAATTPFTPFNTASSTATAGSPDDNDNDIINDNTNLPPTLPSASSQTFEFTTWGPVAEEDTERALKRMAMLARDEHQKDPRRSVEAYYSERLARLIEEAEVEFDATHLR